MNAEYIKRLIARKRAARKELVKYMSFIKDGYKPAWFHKSICKKLTNFAFSKNSEYEMLFIPPQNGKSLHSTIGLPTFLLGLNPKLKIAVISYNSTISSLFGDDISKVLKSPSYKSIFPKTIVGVNGLKDNKYITETTEGGYIISTGVGGSLTSRTVDIFIFDDLYKGPTDAWSKVYRDRVYNFYNTVAETRGHKNEKMLILYTRWHEDDLAGKLLEMYPKKWKATTYQGIKTNDFNDTDDPRKNGEILWEDRHSLDKYIELKERDEIAFEALIQQNPKPVKGLMYPSHLTWNALDNLKGVRKCYVDTADTGKDDLCAIFYLEVGMYNYITDIYFTKDDMDTTYKELAKKLFYNKTEQCVIEGNNGGRFFSTQVKKEVRKIGWNLVMKSFHQNKNKDVRIFSKASEVRNYCLFPKDWKEKFPRAYDSYTKYKREGKNDHDDLQDCLTGVIERNKHLNRAVKKSSNGIAGF